MSAAEEMRKLGKAFDATASAVGGHHFVVDVGEARAARRRAHVKAEQLSELFGPAVTVELVDALLDVEGWLDVMSERHEQVVRALEADVQELREGKAKLARAHMEATQEMVARQRAVVVTLREQLHDARTEVEACCLDVIRLADDVRLRAKRAKSRVPKWVTDLREKAEAPRWWEAPGASR